VRYATPCRRREVEDGLINPDRFNQADELGFAIGGRMDDLAIKRNSERRHLFGDFSEASTNDQFSRGS
jgi:hypothetical protein